MNLVFLYGPPAVGKLTIATELASTTGYKLFHNHLTQDLVRELYPEFEETRFKLVDKIRTTVIRYAADNNTNLIFTFVYSASEEDNTYIADIVKIVESSGGQVMFVELTAKHEDILDRIDNASRAKFHKLTDKKILKDKLEKGSWQSPVNYPDVFKINTSLQNPKESAEIIASHFAISPST